VNKVVSIEIARQVFWIEENTYKQLQNYLHKIKQQLSNDEDANEIYKDIELRVSELFYELNSNESQAISEQQLDQVINPSRFY